MTNLYFETVLYDFLIRLIHKYPKTEGTLTVVETEVEDWRDTLICVETKIRRPGIHMVFVFELTNCVLPSDNLIQKVL